jgi:hypothetical protein
VRLRKKFGDMRDYCAAAELTRLKHDPKSQFTVADDVRRRFPFPMVGLAMPNGTKRHQAPLLIGASHG